MCLPARAWSWPVAIGSRRSECPDGSAEGLQPGAGGDDTEDPPPDPEPGTSSVDPVALLEQANVAFAEADAALEAGDLGLYQEKVDEARGLIDDAFAIINEP